MSNMSHWSRNGSIMDVRIIFNKMTIDINIYDLDLENEGAKMYGSSRYMCVPTMKFVCVLSKKLWHRFITEAKPFSYPVRSFIISECNKLVHVLVNLCLPVCYRFCLLHCTSTHCMCLFTQLVIKQLCNPVLKIFIEYFKCVWHWAYYPHPSTTLIKYRVTHQSKYKLVAKGQ